MQKENGTFLTSDLYLSSWLFYRLNIEPAMRTREKRIVFCFPSSPDLYLAVSQFHEETLVNPAEFSEVLKRLKGAMYDRKAEGANS